MFFSFYNLAQNTTLSPREPKTFKDIEENLKTIFENFYDAFESDEPEIINVTKFKFKYWNEYVMFYDLVLHSSKIS